MANSSQPVVLTSSNANRKTLIALENQTGAWGDSGGRNAGKRIWAPPYWHVFKCDFGADAGELGAVSLASATTDEIDLNTAFPDHAFPEHVLIHKCILRVVEDISGGTVAACTMSVGDTDNADEWVDAENVFTGATNDQRDDFADADAVRAAGGEAPYEAAYAPTLTVDSTTGDVDEITAGEVWVMFLCTDTPEI